MPTLIALYGGTRLSKRSARFAAELARAFLRHPDVVLVSGGFFRHLARDDANAYAPLPFARARSDPHRKETSVDFAVAEAASIEAKQDVWRRVETWLPETPRPKVQRFRLGKSRVLPGSPRARRRQLVQGVDAIVTIAGEVQTALVLETALTAGRLALPIGFTGGDSGDYWRDEHDAFVDTLGLPDALAERIGEKPRRRDEQDLARQIADFVVSRTVRRCLVLMGFSEQRQPFYQEVIEPAIRASGHEPVRLKESEISGHIASRFRDSLRHCARIIADVTDLNPNVMYELGHILRDGRIVPLILTESRSPPTDLPFYLREYDVIHVDDDSTGADADSIIQRYLKP